MPWSSPWVSIGNELDDVTFKKDIFYHQAWKGDNFLELLVPKEEHKTRFFGTHVLNIFIAQRAYGWVDCGTPDQYEFDWPPPGFEEARARYLECKDRFASYNTLIWVDKYSASLAQTINPSTDWPSMMDQTASAIQSFCASTPGFVYMGEIESQVPPSFFEEKIQAFLGSQPYRI